MEVQLARLETKVTEIDADIIEIKKGIDKQDALLEKIVKTSTNIAVLTEQIRALADATKSISVRIKNLEDKPQKYMETICAALITGIIGYVLACFLQ